MKLENDKKRYYYLHLIFFLIIIYSIQDFQTTGNIGIRNVSRTKVHITLLIIIFFLGVYYFYSIFSKGFLRISIHNQLWLINIWIILVNIIQGSDLWSVSIHLGLSTLWILIYSFFSFYIRRFKGAWASIEKFIIIMFGFYVFAALYASYNIQRLYNRIAVVNMVYNVLVFLPWVSLIQNKKKRLFGNVIILVVVLISMKRGAIITLPIMIGISYIIEGIIKKEKRKYFLKIIGLILVFFIAIVIFNYLSNGFISSRFSSEDISTGSGRVSIYKIIIEDIKNRSFIDTIIGKGSGSTIQLLGTVAHNEWLEFLYNFGVIGVVLYFVLFSSLIKTNIKLIKNKSRYASSYSMAITYFFIVGMLGMIYFTHSTIYIMSFFGAIEGLVIREAKNKKYNNKKC